MSLESSITGSTRGRVISECDTAWLQLKGGVPGRTDRVVQPSALTVVLRLRVERTASPWVADSVPWHSAAVRRCARNCCEYNAVLKSVSMFVIAA